MADDQRSNSGVLEKKHTKLKEPDLWKVILLNDDYTPKDFVVEILVSIFHKSPIEATKIMLDVHRRGRGLVGLYPFDIGKTKVAQVTSRAKENEFPLKSVMEKA